MSDLSGNRWVARLGGLSRVGVGTTRGTPALAARRLAPRAGCRIISQQHSRVADGELHADQATSSSQAVGSGNTVSFAAVDLDLTLT
jgi:hypothetical protein